MRTIEKNMLYAVRNWKNRKSGNTQVVVTNEKNGGQTVSVFLHGNKIFEKYQNLDGCCQSYFTLAGWNTPTTRSRLNALGVGVCQKNFCPMRNGQDISSTKWYAF